MATVNSAIRRTTRLSAGQADRRNHGEQVDLGTGDQPTLSTPALAVAAPPILGTALAAASTAPSWLVPVSNLP